MEAFPLISSFQNVSRLPLLVSQSLIIATIFTLAALHARAATITVPAGGNLQGAINSAQLGDTIILQAGATYTGDFILPDKSGSTYLTIQSSRVAELPEGVRVGPAQTPLLARLQSQWPASPIIIAAAGSHHYRFVGVEIATPTSSLVYDLVRFGEANQTSAAVPHHFIIDRSYIHGHPTQEIQRGVTLNGAEMVRADINLKTQPSCGWPEVSSNRDRPNQYGGFPLDIQFSKCVPIAPVSFSVPNHRNHLYSRGTSRKSGNDHRAGRREFAKRNQLRPTRRHHHPSGRRYLHRRFYSSKQIR